VEGVLHEEAPDPVYVVGTAEARLSLTTAQTYLTLIDNEARGMDRGRDWEDMQGAVSYVMFGVDRWEEAKDACLTARGRWSDPDPQPKARVFAGYQSKLDIPLLELDRLGRILVHYISERVEPRFMHNAPAEFVSSWLALREMQKSSNPLVAVPPETEEHVTRIADIFLGRKGPGRNMLIPGFDAEMLADRMRRWHERPISGGFDTFF
jgi:hypothetical protein